MLSFAAIAVFTTTLYAAVRGPVLPATVRSIMGGSKTVRASLDDKIEIL
jgi:hypothetical protein